MSLSFRDAHQMLERYGPDTHIGSRRADVAKIDPAEKTKGALSRLARSRIRLNAAEAELGAAFEGYQEAREDCRKQGIAAHAILSPRMEAFLAAGLDTGPDEDERLELAHLSPAPLPPIE